MHGTKLNNIFETAKKKIKTKYNILIYSKKDWDKIRKTMARCRLVGGGDDNDVLWRDIMPQNVIEDLFFRCSPPVR